MAMARCLVKSSLPLKSLRSINRCCQDYFINWDHKRPFLEGLKSWFPWSQVEKLAVNQPGHVTRKWYCDRYFYLLAYFFVCWPLVQIGRMICLLHLHRLHKNAWVIKWLQPLWIPRQFEARLQTECTSRCNYINYKRLGRLFVDFRAVWAFLPGDNYYYGADELFKYQPNIADNILKEAPFLANTLLEGLIWRSHKSQDTGKSILTTFWRSLVVSNVRINIFVIYYIYISCN